MSVEQGLKAEREGAEDGQTMMTVTMVVVFAGGKSNINDGICVNKVFGKQPILTAAADEVKAYRLSLTVMRLLVIGRKAGRMILCRRRQFKQRRC